MSTDIHIEELSDLTFDPRLADDALFGDTDNPYAILAPLHAEAAVIEASLRELIGMPMRPIEGYDREFTILSYSGVDQVLNDAATFVNAPMGQVLSNFGPLLTVMDAPGHMRWRRLLQRTVRPTIVQRWGEDIVMPVIDKLSRSIQSQGRAELVEQWARPFPFEVIYQLLDLPADDVDAFYKLTIAQIGSPYAAEASQKLGRYFSQLLDARRTAPGDDMVSVVAALTHSEEPLPEDIAVSFLLQLMSAGGETTFRTTTVLLFALLTQPDQLGLLRHDRSLVPFAIEEALRWDGPVIRGTRATTRDVVVDGVLIPAHSLVNVAFGAANRDPAVFTEPDLFDITRERHRHFGFAFGAHNCLGQHLARLEISCALNEFLDRFPAVRLDPAMPEPRIRGANMRTPRQLQVIFDASVTT